MQGSQYDVNSHSYPASVKDQSELLYEQNNFMSRIYDFFINKNNF